MCKAIAVKLVNCGRRDKLGLTNMKAENVQIRKLKMDKYESRKFTNIKAENLQI